VITLNSSDQQITPGGPTLAIQGELNVNTVIEHQAQLLDHLAEHHALSLDLSGVTVCDTAGLQLLLSARRTIEANHGSYQIAFASEAILKGAGEIGIELDAIGLISQPNL